MMRTSARAIALSAVWFVFAGAAFAQDTFTFYYRPGATFTEQRADFEACYPSVVAMRSPYVDAPSHYTSTYYAQSPLGAALGEVIAESAMTRSATLNLVPGNYENCMMVRGWRLVGAEPALAEELRGLDEDELAARLETIVGEPTPRGEVLRAGFVPYTPPPPATVNTNPFAGAGRSLSLRALPNRLLRFPEQRRQRAPMGAATSEQTRARAAERRQDAARVRRARFVALGRNRAFPADLPPSLTEGSAIIILRGDIGVFPLTLVRTDAPDENDDVADTITISGSSLQYYAVTPGHWRVGGIESSTAAVSFCLGSAGFDVAAGDVVYAGWFRYGRAPTDLSLTTVQSALAHTPDLLERLRAAPYRNGETSECGELPTLYAFEIENAPFVEDYHWGSLAPGWQAPPPLPAEQPATQINRAYQAADQADAAEGPQDDEGVSQ